MKRKILRVLLNLFLVVVVYCGCVLVDLPQERAYLGLFQPVIVVSLTFDDGYESQYASALPLLDSFKMKGTFYIITSNMFSKRAGFMDSAQVLDLYHRGHEIGSHTVTHPYIISLGWNWWQVKRSKEDLEKLGIPIRSFAYPYGRESYLYRKFVQAAGYTTARMVGDDYNDLDADQYRLRSKYVLRTTTLPEVEQWVQEVKEHNFWLILCFHRIDTTTNTWGCSPDMLRSICSLLQKNGIVVLTVSDAWKEGYQ
ncbi:MAG TPA: polysaccharide deacetylase family protein [Candidatus Paceibacterota bacterium]|nr:polysaccharide deacetylase family protein [Candidatus Paceibacterota bacterium]